MMHDSQPDALLDLLADGNDHARATLCDLLHTTMPELLARVEALRQQGYHIGDGHGQGITLLPQAGSLLPAYLRRELGTLHFGRGDIFYAPQMDSTNTTLKREAARRVLPGGALAVCDRQTAGRGRMQRAWADPMAGESLTCSLLLRPQLPPQATPLVTLATAVAAAETIAQWGLAPGIKWPNDVVLGGRKCVGILCEAVADPQGALCVVVGTGFNLNQQAFAGELADKATSLRIALGAAVDRRTFLGRYLTQMEQAVAALQSRGLAGIQPQYEARSVTLGRTVQVIGTGESFVGKAEHIDGDGALHVRDAAGNLRRVLSGDVSVRGVMGYV